MEENLVVKNSIEGRLAVVAYNLLMTGRPVTTNEIYIKAFCPQNNDTDYYKPSDEEKKALSKTMKFIRTELERVGCVDYFSITKDPKDGRKHIYQYTGQDNPLAYMILSLQKEYYDFIKATSNILPKDLWVEMLVETDIYETIDSETKCSDPQIISGNGFVQRNIELISTLYYWINQKMPITFRYEKFDGTTFRVFISPHILKEYNGRWFVFGATKHKRTGQVQISQYALDRIISKAKEINKDRSENAKFIPAESGYYNKYFAERVGVTQNFSIEPCDIILRTYDKNTHGRLVSKKLHQSQQTISEFDETKGYGEIRIHVGTTPELIAQILSQGEGLSVVAPLDLRDILKEKVKQLNSRYE